MATDQMVRQGGIMKNLGLCFKPGTEPIYYLLNRTEEETRRAEEDRLAVILVGGSDSPYSVRFDMAGYVGHKGGPMVDFLMRVIAECVRKGYVGDIRFHIGNPADKKLPAYQLFLGPKEFKLELRDTTLDGRFALVEERFALRTLEPMKA
jgi:hypothetical protein